MCKKTVIIGMLGTTLDRGANESRWERWRPTISLGQHEDLLVDRLDLLRSDNFAELSSLIVHDFGVVSPESTIVEHSIVMNNPWDFEEVYAALFDFAKSYPFDTDHEDYLVHITTGTHVIQICLFLLIESHHIPARIIQTQPLPRPRKSIAGSYGIIDLDLSKYDRIAARFQAQSQEGIHFLTSGIETRNPAFNQLVERIAKVSAESTDPILLTGPTGAGKTRLARLIFEWRKLRRRVTGNFVELNCATLRGDAAMSALFGHVKGAYTGALTERAGLLRAADGGMLFLDEIGELGQDEQTMLLRAIEEKRFYPMGSDTEIQSDFQLICGSNQPLRKMAREGKFRADLLARINLWTFPLPGLRNRPEDIEPNIRYELERNAERRGRQVSFSKEALQNFLTLATSPAALWSGNFRDLAGAVTRLSTLAEGGRITQKDVKEEWERLKESWKTEAGSRDSDQSTADQNLVREVLGEQAKEIDLFDLPQLAVVIRECRKSATLSEAGRRLFAASRQSKTSRNDADRLRKYLARFNLEWKDVMAAPATAPVVDCGNTD